MKYQNSMDVNFKRNGFWVWLAKRLNPGDKCIRWNYYMCDWSIEVVIEQKPIINGVELETIHGYDSESWYRLRPMWFRFFPSYWIWQRK